MKYTTLKTSCLAALSFLMLLSGCITDEEQIVTGGKTPIGSPEDVTVVMSLTLPGAATTTRALTPEQEDEVKTIDILVFDKDLALTDWQYGQLKTDGDDVSFSALLKASKNDADKFRLMVLANVRTTTYNLFKGDDFGGHKGKSYADVCALLKAAVPAYSDVYTNGLPMWGELKDPVTLMSNATNQYNLDLLRSLARIDVGTHANPQFAASGQITGWAALSNFSLEEVRVYKASTQYALAARDAYDFTAKTVNTPTLPSTNGKITAPVLYNDVLQGIGTVTRTGGKGYALTGSIYTGEANVKMGGTYGDANHAQRTAIVVAGKYNGSNDLSYYRLDFTQNNGSTLMDILRGKDYQIIIKSVSGPGKPSAEDALETVNADMTIVVRTWNSGGSGNHDFDGQYSLKVNQTEFVLPVHESSQMLEITTDFPGNAAFPKAGWTIKDITYLTGESGWLTAPITATIGGVGTTSTAITVTANTSMTANQRSASFIVTAGNMSRKIMVTQERVSVPGIKAVSGVIGYIWNPGQPNHLQLTLDGDKSYFGNPAGQPRSVQNKYTVYVAYFKWGSLIALSSQNHSGNFMGLTDIVAAKGYTRDPQNPDHIDDPAVDLARAISGIGNNYWYIPPYPSIAEWPATDNVGFPDKVNGYAGIGDACRHYFGEEWRVPTAVENVRWVGGADTGTSEETLWKTWAPGGSQYTYSDNKFDYWDNARAGTVADPGMGRFPVADQTNRPAYSGILPAAGGRFTDNGNIHWQGEIGDYWSSTMYDGSNGYHLDFGSAGMTPANVYSFTTAFAIRCVRTVTP